MRKKIVLTSVIVTLFLLGILCYKSWVAAFVATKYLSGRKDGKRGIVPSIIAPWPKHQLHLHNWILSLIGGGISAVKGFYILAPDVFYGFLSAIIFQGIYCYGDWYQIVKRKSVRLTLEKQMSLAAESDPEALDYYRYNEACDNRVHASLIT